MAAPDPHCLSAAVQKHLQRLALQDFPCGLGSWNESRFVTCAGSSGQEDERPLGEESPEALLELLSDPRSPWALPPGCSAQDQHLRDVAVLDPQLTQGSRVFKLFRSLRITGKDVEEVDKDLLQLQNLEELILCTNQISRITSANLPRTLKVSKQCLLCCNAVSDLQGLCAQPPPELQHLGLGYNRLQGPLQDKCFTAELWPNLISLDLSFNNLTDLFGLVSQLSSLKKLRILLLQGNPLALIPAYRGFVVDSLPKLSFFDDIHIELDERYQFRGLSKQPARVVVSIGEMKGVPDPSTLQELEIGSEEPVITYSYCVTYEFAGEETEDGGTEVGAQPDQLCQEGASLFQVENLQNPAVATPDLDNSAQDVKETKGQEESIPVLRKQSSLSKNLCLCTAKVFVTPGEPWADTIDCNYRKEHIAKDLLGLKDYLRAGTVVSVVEEKVGMWQAALSSPCSTGSSPAGWKRKKGKTGDKEGQQQDMWAMGGDGIALCLIKGPDTCACIGALQGAGTKDKQKKKKKEKPRELRSDPPIRRILGSQRVALETLLATETLVATVCDFGVLITEQLQQSPSQEEKLVGSCAGGKNKGSAEQEEDCELQPVPLTVEFQMQLLRWPMADTQHGDSVTKAESKAQ
uniref:Leucine rich repeat containing 43 n=1 Tax=Coturnix japonica TaxID=93934 RepID=A0A8C2UEC0_COTJA